MHLLPLCNPALHWQQQRYETLEAVSGVFESSTALTVRALAQLVPFLLVEHQFAEHTCSQLLL